MPGVQGTCEARFAPLQAAFHENFERRDEHGAALAVWQRGRPVVDLWGGWRDAAGTRPWEADTLVCMMSVAKAVTALLVHVLVEQGRLALDAPVARYWPEFAANGKAGVRVRDVLDHRAGIPVVARDLPADAIFDWDAMTDVIAVEPPVWPPGTVPAYHVVTMGFVAGELIRRVTGKTTGAFLREVAAEIGGLDYYIGVDAADLDRCAELSGDFAGTIFGSGEPGTLAHWSVAQVRPWMFGTEAFRRAEIPSINGHGTARSVASLFGRLAECRAAEAAWPLSAAAAERATAPQWHAIEQTSMQERRMALGFVLPGVPAAPLGGGPAAFGHGGAGGALAFADPDLRLGFAYAPSRLYGGKGASPRTRALVDALARCPAVRFSSP